MKKYIFSALVILFPIGAAAQHPGGITDYLAWSSSSDTSLVIKGGSGMTFIGVYSPSGKKEQTLWSAGTSKSTSLIQTTSRSADLSRGTFMNYTTDSLSGIRMYSYSTSSSALKDMTLNIGHASDNTLPVSDIPGGLSEYVIYDRALSSIERGKAESYMAIKYGITQYSSYLNSKGVVAWNKYNNSGYLHRIAGVITDSLSGLRQSSSISSESGAFVSINADKLEEGQSVLWGDDNGKLSFTNSKMYGKWLGRKWKSVFTTSDVTSEKPLLSVTALTERLRQIAPLASGESYYLAVDTTGTGSFPVRGVRYYRMSSSNGSEACVFNSVPVTAGAVFTLRAGKSMFTTIELTTSSESSSADSKLGILITGGEAPFRNKLQRDGSIVCDRTSADTIVTVQNLSEGTYSLMTTDISGNTDEKEFTITSTGIAEVPSDDNTDTSGSNVFANMEVSPNPTTDGYVKVKTEFSEERPLTVSLYSHGGALLSSTTFASDTYHELTVSLPSVGIYLLRLKSMTEEKTVKLTRK